MIIKTLLIVLSLLLLSCMLLLPTDFLKRQQFKASLSVALVIFILFTGAAAIYAKVGKFTTVAAVNSGDSIKVAQLTLQQLQQAIKLNPNDTQIGNMYLQYKVVFDESKLIATDIELAQNLLAAGNIEAETTNAVALNFFNHKDYANAVWWWQQTLPLVKQDAGNLEQIKFMLATAKVKQDMEIKAKP